MGCDASADVVAVAFASASGLPIYILPGLGAVPADFPRSEPLLLSWRFCRQLSLSSSFPALFEDRCVFLHPVCNPARQRGRHQCTASRRSAPHDELSFFLIERATDLKDLAEEQVVVDPKVRGRKADRLPPPLVALGRRHA